MHYGKDAMMGEVDLQQESSFDFDQSLKILTSDFIFQPQISTREIVPISAGISPRRYQNYGSNHRSFKQSAFSSKRRKLSMKRYIFPREDCALIWPFDETLVSCIEDCVMIRQVPRLTTDYWLCYDLTKSFSQRRLCADSRWNWRHQPIQPFKRPILWTGLQIQKKTLFEEK